MLTVKKAADLAQVTADAVRHYVKLGLIVPSRNPGNNYKQFSPTDVKHLKFIKRAQQIGFTLSDIKQLLHDAEQEESPCPRARDIIASRISENQQTLQELQQLVTTMEQALQTWGIMKNQEPTGNTICHLVEDWITEH